MPNGDINGFTFTGSSFDGTAKNTDTSQSAPVSRFGNTPIPTSELPPLVSPHREAQKEQMNQNIRSASLQNIILGSRNKDYVNPNPNVNQTSKVNYNPIGMADESSISDSRNDVMDKIMKLVTAPVLTAVSGTGEGLQSLIDAGDQARQGNIGTGILEEASGLAQTGMSLATLFYPVMSGFDIGGQALENIGGGDIEKYGMSPVESLTNPTSIAGKSGAKLADLLYNLLLFKGVDKGIEGIKNLGGESNASTVRGNQEVIPQEGKEPERSGEVSGNGLQRTQTGGSQAGNERIGQQGTKEKTTQYAEGINQGFTEVKPITKQGDQGTSKIFRPEDFERVIRPDKYRIGETIELDMTKRKPIEYKDSLPISIDRKNNLEQNLPITIDKGLAIKLDPNAKIISTAVKKGEQLFTGDKPIDSHDAIGEQKGIKKIPESRKGFIAQDVNGQQKFVDRKQAAEIANNAGQTTKSVKELHSKDLKPVTKEVPREGEQPVKKGRVMSLKAVEGEGDTKTRGLSQRFSNDMSKDMQENFDLPEYNVRKNAPQIQKVSDIAASDPDRLVRMYLGQEKIPDNILPGFIYSGVKQLAKEGKIDPESLTHIAKSDFIPKQGTSAGQVVQSFIDKDPLDPINAIKDVTKVREDNVLKRSGVKDLDKVKDRVADQISKETKKHNLQPKDWTGFLKSIECT